MSPADIHDSAEFREGLARRLAEVGLIPPEPAAVRLAPLPETPVHPAGEHRKAA
jgi:hypothetical protein